MSTVLPGGYPGSKKRIMGELLPLFPPHAHFVSVFGGIGSEILAKEPSTLETYNDINADNYNFFRVLQDHTESLIRRLELIPYSQREYEDAYDLIHSHCSDSFRRAVAYGVIANMCRVGHDPSIAARASFGYCVRGHGQPQQWVNIRKIVSQVAARFRRVQVINKPWEWVLQRFDAPDTLFCIDPPYPPHLLNSGPKYRHNKIDHEFLLRQITALKGMSLVFSYPNKLYSAYLRGWSTIKLEVVCSTSSRRRKSRRREQIWYRFWR